MVELKELISRMKEAISSDKAKRYISNAGKLIAVLIILALVFSSLAFVLKINIMLKGGVLISIDPPNRNILTQSRDPMNVSYSVDIENRLFCKAECEYRFRDLSDFRIIDSGSFSAKDEHSLELEYSLDPPDKGTGQLAYELIVECTNQRTYFCRTGEISRQKSSFLTLSYDLSIEERKMVEDIRNALKADLESLKKMDIAVKELSHKIDSLAKRIYLNGIEEEVAEVREDVNELRDLSVELSVLWAEEEYQDIARNLAAFRQGIDSINSSVSVISDELEAHLISFNETKSHLMEYDGIIENYQKLRYIGNVLGTEPKDYLDQYAMILNRFNSNDTLNYSYIAEEKDNLSQNLSNDLEMMMEDLESVNNEGRDILNITSIGIGNQYPIQNHDDICTEVSIVQNKSILLSSYENEYCTVNITLFNLSMYDLTVVPLPEVPDRIFESSVNTSLKEHLPICCIFDECRICCNEQSCIDDEANYPVLLVHGHAASEESSIENSLSSFNSIRREFVSDGFIDGGTILPSDSPDEHELGVLGRYRKPVVVSTTYYIDPLTDEEDILSLISKDKDIDTYAERLDEAIENTMFRTGSSKINIVAHSMGGLVARKYLTDHGEERVNKLIMVATPNKGIEGRIESFCSLTGNQKECLQMQSTSDFINDLNNPENRPDDVETYVIFGEGCLLDGKESDGVVLASNTKLPFSLNFGIEGSCGETTLHEDLLDTDKYPEVYSIIRNILRN